LVGVTVICTDRHRESRRKKLPPRLRVRKMNVPPDAV
jgi:hypothetical protein